MTNIITNKSRTLMFLVVVMTIVTVIAYHGEAIQCPQVNMYLAQCLPYLKTGGSPTAMCCAGLNNLKAAAPAKPDRQVACNCLKGAANTIPGISDDNAKQLPGKCNVDLGVPFSKTVDCNSVN